DGDPVVFLHGFGLDARMWEPQFKDFERSLQVIRYDLRGFGRSSLPPTAPYAHEDDLMALLAHLGVARAHVVGLSMGGRMALRFALAYPDATRSLVLAESALDGHKWSAEWQARWSEICETAKAGDLDGAKHRWLEHPLFAFSRAIRPVRGLLAGMI